MLPLRRCPGRFIEILGVPIDEHCIKKIKSHYVE